MLCEFNWLLCSTLDAVWSDRRSAYNVSQFMAVVCAAAHRRKTE